MSREVYSVRTKIEYQVEPVHICNELVDANKLRKLDRETPVFVFKDISGESWNIKTGRDFVDISHCPFCGMKLC